MYGIRFFIVMPFVTWIKNGMDIHTVKDITVVPNPLPKPETKADGEKTHIIKPVNPGKTKIG